LRHRATICLRPSGDRGLPLPTLSLSLSGFIHSVFTAFFLDQVLLCPRFDIGHVFSMDVRANSKEVIWSHCKTVVEALFLTHTSTFFLHWTHTRSDLELLVIILQVGKHRCF
jgi:hypothetical protein